jgi:hypothetical protein
VQPYLQKRLHEQVIVMRTTPETRWSAHPAERSGRDQLLAHQDTRRFVAGAVLFPSPPDLSSRKRLGGGPAWLPC